jgi:hypothetical protein
MKQTTAMISFLAGSVFVGLGCWLVMFLAGHDVWHFTGRPNFWQLSGPPFADLRAFALAFYLQLLVLLALLGVVIWQLAARRGQGKGD